MDRVFKRVGKGYYVVVGMDHVIMFRGANRLKRQKPRWVVRLNGNPINTFTTLKQAKEYVQQL
tara:strand:+ start:320 stop:508 length:189 start_codon:yes stop_codon:yes gene_type:complete